MFSFVLTKKNIMFNMIRNASILFHLYAKYVYGPTAIILINNYVKNNQINTISNALVI